MNWKLFITACASSIATFFPGNGITCGPSEDPHDYFTSFFSNKLGSDSVYQPFYYTSLLKFYDEQDYWYKSEDTVSSINSKLAGEWASYAKNSSIKDVIQLLYYTKGSELKNLSESSKGGKAFPGSLSKNSFAQALFKEKKEAAIDYLAFALRTQTAGNASVWEDRPRDSLQQNKWIAEADHAYATTTDPFLKNKYAFQRCKLAFYNNRHTDCIRWYDEYFKEENTSAVNELALSYKAGSLFRLRKLPEAAYHYAKAFQLSDYRKKVNYTGFLWATDFCNQSLLPAYTARCKNAEEKALVTALFGMYGTDPRLEVLQTVYELNPASPLLPLLTTREINKLEEQYLTSSLAKEKGGKAMNGNWIWMPDEDSTGKSNTDNQSQVTKTAQFFETLLTNKAVPNRGLYGAGAAYLRFMNKDYEGAKKVLAKTGEAPKDDKVKDQAQLIQLLVAANEGKTFSKEREAQLLPSIKWLVQKAKEERDYQLFCRNFFSEILSQKYEQQGDLYKAALSYGVAELAFIKRAENDFFYAYPPALYFVRDEMTTESLLRLYEVVTAPATEMEKFLVQHTSLKRDEVIDAIGTSHLRDRQYAKAAEWLSKARKLEPLVETKYNYQTDKSITVNVDPLHDYLNDWQRLNKTVTTPYTKFTLAKKLLELETKINSSTGNEDKARLYYQYASALYNMSFYGNSWSAVAYDRTGSDWNEGTYTLPWEKEYYGVYTAKEFYQKAYQAALHKEFKAACLFMVIKCSQRQLPRPTYHYKEYKDYEEAEALFLQKFKNNPLFWKFKTEFGTTKFYQYAHNRCSYLRDYVKKSTAPRRTGINRGKEG